ncbi:4314_t:CDS:10 [Cetraspora pellucida]|uniref:4314_t:CDS:1 n=1 Tax=Cetraspora pellucida TaxID=1433469 RepID=A0ACA9KXI1_9GLOM|nr:4314_t:CDS:10 [Cetraspora pellucida]
MDGQPPSDEQKEAERFGDNASLKAQLEQMFAPFDKSGLGRIASKDLFKIIEAFESEQKANLLKDEDRTTLQMFCEQNPDMEVSVDDVLQLVTKLKTPPTNVTASLSSSSNVVSEQPTKSKIKYGSIRSAWNRPSPRTYKSREALTISTEIDGDEYGSSSTSATNRSRRMSSGYYDSPSGVLGSNFSKLHYDTSDDHEMSFEGSGGFDDTVSQLLPTNDDPAVQLSRLYRHTVDLTKRLKESERHLASVARQHEDRIEELQHKLEDTKADLMAKKREIQDHKNKEKTNLHQIAQLEGEIQIISKNLSGQMQLYHQLKKQYEEQREEAEKFRDLVKIKEEELFNTQRNLNAMSSEEKKWFDERERLEHALCKLEQDLTSAQASEIELEEQKNENMHLKETIDKLKLDLDEIRNVGSGKNLRAELHDTALASISEEQQGSDSNTDELRRSNKESRPRKTNDDESLYSRPGEVEKSRGAEDHVRRSNGQRPVRRQATDANNSPRNSTGSRDVESQYQILSSELGVQYALIEGILRNRDLPSPHDRRDRQIRNSMDGDSADLTRRLSRQTSSRKNRRKANHVSENEPPSERAENAQSSRALVPRNNDMNVAQRNAMVNNTVTLALYTLVIYFFGIITSVFVLDNNQGPYSYSDWLPYEVVKDDSWTARSMEIILYWVENLLNDGNMRVPT